MRKEKSSLSRSVYGQQQSLTAKKLYHAIQQARSGNLNRAENIYRRTLEDIKNNSEDGCSNAELATTTLLLALVLQRMGDIGEASLVFHRFFRREKDSLTECKCTAKVLSMCYCYKYAESKWLFFNFSPKSALLVCQPQTAVFGKPGDV